VDEWRHENEERVRAASFVHSEDYVTFSGSKLQYTYAAAPSSLRPRTAIGRGQFFSKIGKWMG